MRKPLSVCLGFALLCGACKKSPVDGTAEGEAQFARPAQGHSPAQIRYTVADLKKIREREGDGQPLRFEDREEQRKILTALALADPEKTYELLKQNLDLNDLRTSSAVVQAVLEQRGQAVIIEQFKALRNLYADKEENRLMVATLKAFGYLPSLDPGTIEFFRKYSDRADASSPIAGLLMTTSTSRGADASLDLLSQFGLKGKAKEESLLFIARGATDRDPAMALKILRTVKTEDSSEVYRNLFETWFTKDSNAATKVFSDLPWQEKSKCFQNPIIVNEIADHGGEQALWAAVDQAPLTADGNTQVAQLLKVISVRDPERATDKINGLAGSPGGPSLANQVFGELGRLDPDKALEGWKRLDGKLQDVALSGILTGTLKNGLSSSLEWIKKNDPPLSESNRGEFISAVADLDANEAWSLMNTGQFDVAPTTEKRSEIITKITSGLSKQDSAKAASWVTQLDESDAVAAAPALVSNWFAASPDDASKWLDSLKPGQVRDAGVKVLIQQLKDTDPDRAKQWQDTLSPPSDAP